MLARLAGVTHDVWCQRSAQPIYISLRSPQAWSRIITENAPGGT